MIVLNRRLLFILSMGRSTHLRREPQCYRCQSPIAKAHVQKGSQGLETLTTNATNLIVQQVRYELGSCSVKVDP